MADPLLKHGWHWSFGWLRRPDLDEEGMYCYEQPDGDLVFSKRREHREQMYLDCRIDEDLNEPYTCLARIPRRTSYRRRTR